MLSICKYSCIYTVNFFLFFLSDPPSVSVTQQFSGTSLNLSCNVEGNPKRYTFDKWYHRSEYNETIRKFKGTPEGNLIIGAPSKTQPHENDGLYICRVSNGIPDTYTNVYQEGAVLIQTSGKICKI